MLSNLSGPSEGPRIPFQLAFFERFVFGVMGQNIGCSRGPGPEAEIRDGDQPQQPKYGICGRGVKPEAEQADMENAQNEAEEELVQDANKDIITVVDKKVEPAPAENYSETVIAGA